MTPAYTDPLVTLYEGDCLDVMRELPDASVDSVVTDPPYDLTNRTPDVKACESCGRVLGGADGKPDVCPRCGGQLSFQRSVQGRGFMGKAWDGTGIAFDPETWRLAFRVLKPGGYLLAFGGTRTVHRLASAIEDAGFEIRDTLMWIYASGFPKSLDVSKALDKVAGAEREVVGRTATPFRVDNAAHRGTSLEGSVNGDFSKQHDDDGYRYTEHTAPATDLARKWEGWGTALKPAHEPIVMARKPLVGTVAANVTRYGVGAINVDACRIPGGADEQVIVRATEQPTEVGIYSPGARPVGEIASANAKGRWPSNVMLGDPELFDEPNPWVVGSGATSVAGQPQDERGTGGIWSPSSGIPAGPQYGDSGGYSRFYAIPRYNRTCVRCGVTIAERSSKDGTTPAIPSDSAAESVSPTGSDVTAPSASSAASSSRRATTPTVPTSAPTSGDEGSGSRSEAPSTSASEPTSWLGGDETTKPTRRSRRHGTSRASTPPSSPAKYPDAASPEIVTTTTTPARSMCATCVEAITSPTTSDSDGLPEPYPRALIIPKADRAERERGLAGAPLQEMHLSGGRTVNTSKGDGSGIRVNNPRANVHPTVKPIDLMRHLVRLVTPPGGVTLDPFLGSGTTALAASEEGFRCIGIEREAEYLEIAVGRLMATPMGLGLDVPAPETRRKVLRDYEIGGNGKGSHFGHIGNTKPGVRFRDKDEDAA